MRLDAHEHSEPEKQRYHRRSAIAHERQGDTDDGEDPADHAHVDESVGEEAERD